MDRLRAVIVAPKGGDAQADVACLNHCADRKYELVGVIADGEKAIAMLQAGTIDVVVAASEAHLPADYPRVEIVSERRPRPRNELRGRGPGSTGTRHRGLL